MIAPSRTEPGGPAWKQTIFEPFARIAAAARGEVALVLVNRSTESPVDLTVDARAFQDLVPDGRLDVRVEPVSWRVVRLRPAPRPGS